jgi:hypothetical protein
MNRKDPCTFFDEWLTAYSDRLHMVRQGMKIDFVSPKENKPLPASSKKTAKLPAHNHKSSNA